ncbi:hypothetical protein BaRGS_00028101 [Batillaria attramentaria]|uniref:Uncharacterized protein n=1 Tax=Batillaria attramentaria TaxID=370345 RepID=A0ABD0K0T4_9CAEN
MSSAGTCLPNLPGGLCTGTGLMLSDRFVNSNSLRLSVQHKPDPSQCFFGGLAACLQDIEYSKDDAVTCLKLLMSSVYDSTEEVSLCFAITSGRLAVVLMTGTLYSGTTPLCISHVAGADCKSGQIFVKTLSNFFQVSLSCQPRRLQQGVKHEQYSPPTTVTSTHLPKTVSSTHLAKIVSSTHLAKTVSGTHSLKFTRTLALEADALLSKPNKDGPVRDTGINLMSRRSCRASRPNDRSVSSFHTEDSLFNVKHHKLLIQPFALFHCEPLPQN